MSTVALALYTVALVVLFGVRSSVQHRRTGTTGFRGISGTPADADRWAGCCASPRSCSASPVRCWP